MGDPAAAIDPLWDLFRAGSDDQSVTVELMRCLDAVGRPQEALAVYQHAYEQIVRTAGLEIGAELMGVHLGVLRGDLRARERPAAGPRQTATGPLLIGGLPPRADSFQARAEAYRLRAAASGGKTTVLTQVVAGLGGVGKTQLAADFSRTAWENRDVDLLVWVSALDRASVVSGYVQASTELALGPENEAPERTAARLLSWLARTDKRWLVVLDDLAGPTDVRDLWPPDRPNGRTVVTTRRRDADLLSGRELVEVGVFAQDEAVAYLSRKLRDRPRLADDISGVVEDLGALPLALSHAAAYMIDMDLPCSGYRRRFRDRKRRLPDLFAHPDTLFDGYSRTVATTWGLSIDAADELPPIVLARPLLELVSSLNPNGIPASVFTSPQAREYLYGRLSWHPSQEDIRDGLRGLHRFHLVSHEDDLVRVHALVQRAAREELGAVASTAVARAAADAILQIWPAADTDDGHVLRANAMALQDNWAAAIWDHTTGIHPIMLRTIESLGTSVQLGEAIQLCRTLVGQAVEFFGPRHSDTLALRNQLATWLGDAGESQEAITVLGALLPDATATLAPDNPMVIEARRNLAHQWGQAGHPSHAAEELRKVVNAQKRVFGAESAEVITSRDQLLYWRGKAGDHAGIVEELEELVDLSGRVLGATDRQNLPAPLQPGRS